MGHMGKQLIWLGITAPLRCALRRCYQNLILNLRVVIRTQLFKVTAKEKGASISQAQENGL